MFSSLPHVFNNEDALASIDAMRMQEENGYQTADYMTQAEPEKFVCNGPQLPVDSDCRSKMSQWCFQVVDFCKFNRETVAIAMSYLDRFLMTPAGVVALNDRKIFQLAAMTSLYTAIKIHEPEAMEPKIVASLSRGAYTEEEVTDMERTILMAIKWRMNPPTAMSFVHHFMDLMPEGAMTEEQKEGTIELIRYQTELAVNEYDFVGINASTIAFAALSNAFQYNGATVIQDEFLAIVAQSANLNRAEAMEAQDQLYYVIENATHGRSAGALRPTTVSKNTGGNSSIHNSPRSVSAQ